MTAPVDFGFGAVQRCPESDAIAAAADKWGRAVDEFKVRRDNISRITDPDARQAEVDFLNRWGHALRAERARLQAWTQDLARRQQTPAPVQQPTVPPVVGQAAQTFWTASFRSKVGVIGWGLFGLGVVVFNASNGLGGLLGFIGLVMVFTWFVSGLMHGFGGRGRQTVVYGGGGAAEAHMAAMRAEEARMSELARVEAEARAAAEARRQEAIERARAAAGGDDSMEW